jgi:hypothetical protein
MIVAQTINRALETSLSQIAVAEEPTYVIEKEAEGDEYSTAIDSSATNFQRFICATNSVPGLEEAISHNRTYVLPPSSMKGQTRAHQLLLELVFVIGKKRTASFLSSYAGAQLLKWPTKKPLSQLVLTFHEPICKSLAEVRFHVENSKGFRYPSTYLFRSLAGDLVRGIDNAVEVHSEGVV